MVHTIPADLINNRHVQAINAALPAIFSVMLVVAIAHGLSKVTWALFPEKESSTSIITSKPAPRQTRNNNQAFNQLTNAHLFGIANAPVSTGQKNAPETKLNLILRGVLAATPMERASAIIARGKSGKEEIYGIDDKLPGGVSVKEIHPEYVVLLRNGQLETLRLIKESGLGSLSSNKRINKSTTQRVPSTPTEALNDIRASIKNNPASFGDYAIPVPVKQNGKLIGYRLKPQEKGSLLRTVGLQSNDIITSINGTKLDQPKNGINALRNLTNATEINITVLRNGVEVPIFIPMGK